MTLFQRRPAAAGGSPKPRTGVTLRKGAAIALTAAVLLSVAQPAAAAEPAAQFQAQFSGYYMSVDWGSTLTVDYLVTNNSGAPLTGMNFGAKIPDGFSYSPGYYYTPGCGDNPLLSVGSTSISVFGIETADGDNCLISVTVKPAAAGTFSIGNVLTSSTSNIVEAQTPSFVTVNPGEFVAAPATVTASQTAPGTTRVDWSAVTDTNGNGPVSEYVVRVEKSVDGIFDTISNHTTTDRFLVFEDLQEATGYKFFVKALTDTAESLSETGTTFIVPINRTELSDLVAEAGTKGFGEYTTKSYTPVFSLYFTSKTVLDDPASTLEQVNAAEDDLTEALGNLIDIRTLNAAVTANQSRVSSDYRSASWAPFASALADAHFVLSVANSSDPGLDDVTQQEVTDTVEALVETALALSPLSSVRDSLSADAETVAPTLPAHQAVMTKHSFKQLSDAVDVARELVATASTDETVLDKASADLASASLGLVRIDELRTAVAEAEAIADGDYSADTAAGFALHLAKAQEVLADDAAGEEISPTTISDRTADLINHIGLLVDLAESRALVTRAESLSPSNYTAYSWAEVENEMPYAKRNLTRTGLNQLVVDADATYLADALNALVSIVEIKELRAEFEAMDRTDYTAFSWINMSVWGEGAAAFLEAAADPEIQVTGTQEGVAIFHEAKGGLVHVSQLRESLSFFDGFNSSEYSKRSVAELFAARDAGYALMIDAEDESVEVTTEQVIAAISAVEAAKGELVRVAELEQEIAWFYTFEMDGFTAFSAHKLRAAITVAEALISTEAAVTTEQVANALTEINNSVSSLVGISSLRNQVESYDELDASVYTAASAAQFTNAWDAAKQLLTADESVEVTIEQMNTAINAMSAAHSKLVSVYALKLSLETAGHLVAKDFTTTSWAALTAAVANGEALVARATDPTEQISAEEITVINDAIWDAIIGLKLVSNEPKPEDPKNEPNLIEQTVTDLRAAVASLKFGGAAVTLPTKTDQGATISYTVTGAATLADGKIVPARAGTFTLGWSADAVDGAKATTGSLTGIVKAGSSVSFGGKQLSAGAKIAIGSTLQFNGSGLLPGSKFRAELHSDPILLGTVTVDADGNAVLNAVIPSNVPAGKHTLHVFSTLADGTEVDQATVIEITKLPVTGGEIPLPLLGGAALLIAAGVWMVTRRREIVKAQ